MRKPDPPSPVTPKWLLPALLVLAGVFLLGLLSTEMADPDSWWHLATGRYIVAHHRLPVPDPFAYTTALVPADATQRFNLTHEWLAQAVWYAILAGGGFGAVVLWKALLLTLLCGLTGMAARRRTGSWWWGIAAALGAASLAIEFAHDRPSILSYVFTAAFIVILEDGRLRLAFSHGRGSDQSRDRKGVPMGLRPAKGDEDARRGPGMPGPYSAAVGAGYPERIRKPDIRPEASGARLLAGVFDGAIYLLPLLALVWANSHGGFFLGWIVCGAYAVDALARRAPGGALWARRILLASGVSVLLSGFNPNGFAALATVWRYRQSPMQATLIEWSRADLWGPPYAFDLLLYAAALSLALSWRRVRVSDWLLFAAFAAASLMAFRNEMLIGLLAPILIASYFPLGRLRLPAAARAIASYAGLAALAAAIVWGTARGSFFQLRAAEWGYPSGAAAFLRDHRIAAPLFNTYEFGGYLIWRGLPVFIDGRALSEPVFEDYRRILGTPPGDPLRDQVLARYGVGAIAINSFEYNSGVLYPLVLALAQPGESAWKLVYEDAQSLVFLRDPPAGLPALDKRRIVDHLESECRLHIERDPEFSLCARTLADLLLRSGDTARARRMLALYLAHPYADDPAARSAYLKLLSQ